MAAFAVAALGAVLAGLALWRGLRGRSRKVKAVAIPVTILVMVQFYVLPLLAAGLATYASRPDAPAAARLGVRGAREVSFAARDGVRLAGWYVPGRNGGAVILMHGSHGTRADTVDHLRMLARRGFAVLSFDARGHGQSAGQTNALGWQGTEDVAGAVGFLRRQRGVDPRRIDALGLSMGAEEALRAAAEGVPLAAAIADGAGASTSGDKDLVEGGALAHSVNWLGMRATELFSGQEQPKPLVDAVGAIRSPVLLIASSATGELTLDRTYRDRIGRNAALWSVPDAAHTKALERHPAAYARRVAAFLDRQ